MSPPASPRRDEQSVPDGSKDQDDSDCSPWKQLKDQDGRNYSYADTASLTCSDSLNSSLTDTDEETCSLSPDNSLKTRHTRLSPIPRAGELPRNLHVIEDMSFDSDCSMADEKLHEPSSQQKCQNRRGRLIWMLPLAMVGLVYYRLYPPARRTRVDPQDWKHFLKYEAPQVRKLIETSPIPHAFTVKLTGSRVDLLERSVEILTRCALVEEVQVEWQSTMRPPRKLFQHPSNKVVPSERLENNSVLLLDEDVIFTCDELERGFHLWRLDPDRMVGFFPYRHTVPYPQSLLEYTTSATASPVSLGSGKYELISSRAVFVHKEYLESFDFIEDSACSPFALSVHCTAISAKAPLAVAAAPQEQRTSDIVPLLSNRQQWTRDEVSLCLKQWIEGHDIESLPSEESTYLGA